MASRSFGSRAVILSLAAVTVVAAGLRGRAVAQERRPAQKPAFTPKMGDVVRETQKAIHDSDGLTLVWWLPTEFWVLSARQSAGAQLTEAEVRQFGGLFQKYVIVGVISAKMRPSGGTRFSPARPRSVRP